MRAAAPDRPTGRDEVPPGSARRLTSGIRLTGLRGVLPRLPLYDGRLETIIVFAALLGTAGAARWPNLWLIPTFTDETIEVKLAYEIARGQVAPLTNVDPYIGAFWNWLLAIGFWLFGLNPWLPRLLAFVSGVATVGATWWLGREIGGRASGRLGGFVAALFMAGCSTHILVN